MQQIVCDQGLLYEFLLENNIELEMTKDYIYFNLNRKHCRFNIDSYYLFNEDQIIFVLTNELLEGENHG